MTNQGVCVVTHPLGAAGENATRTLLDILVEIDTVSLVTADLPTNSSIHDNREVIELTQKGSGNSVLVAATRFLVNQLRMCVVIRQRPEDIILFFGATAYVLPILFARAIGKTVLTEPRGDVPLTLQLNWEQRMPDALARALANGVRLFEWIGFVTAHAVITYTPNMARQLGLDPDSPNVYPHGARYVDTERFRPTTPVRERDVLIGFVGRLDEEKGIRTLAAVAKQLPDGVTFRFVGDGPLYEWLESELAAEIECDSVELAGWVDHDDIPVELNKIKLLVMPSRPTEGLPTTILEAMACGTPVYATPVSGVPDIVFENKTGFVMCEDNHTQIVRRINDALDTHDIQKMSQNCRELIETEYSLNAAVTRYKRLLTELTE